VLTHFVLLDQEIIHKLKNMTAQNFFEYVAEKLNVNMKERLEVLKQYHQFDVDFEQREEVKDQLSKIYDANKEAFELNLIKDINKQRIHVGDAIGGAGQGKTRTCKEAIRILREYEKNDKINFYSFYWDSRNGLSLQEYESIVGCIGIRLFSLLLGITSFDTYAEIFGSNWRDNSDIQIYFSITNVLEFIGKQIRVVNNGVDAYNVIIVCIDEYQSFYEKFKSNWTQPLHSLMLYMCSTQGPNQNLQRDRLCIVPIISGTLPAELTNFHITEYTMVHFKFRPFTFGTIQKIMKKLLGEELFFQAMKTNESKRFWYEIGIIPRILIDYTIKGIVLKKESIKFDENGLSDLWNMVLERVERSNPFEFSKIDVKQLYLCVMSNASIPKYRKAKHFQFLEDLEIRGLIYNGYRNQIYLPFHHFRQLVKLCNPYLAEKLPKMRSLFTWEYFESFEAEAFCSRINFLIEEGNKSVFLHDLFPGAETSHLNFLEIKLPCSCELVEDETKFINNNKYVDVDLLKQELSEEQKLVHRTKKGCTAIDAFWITSCKSKKTGEVKNVMFCIQYSNCEDPNKETYKDPPAWANSTYDIFQYIPEFENYEFLFILITNGVVPNEKIPPLKIGSKSISNIQGQKNLIVVSKKIAAEYFATNLLPFYEVIDNLPENDRISSSQPIIDNSEHIQQSMEQVDIEIRKKHLKRRRSLSEMGYKDLQRLAKKKGIKANQSKKSIIKQLQQMLDE